MIRRDPRAAAEPHDIVIVGGGIYGATLLLEAARAGRRALLLERGDYGGATSWNTLRIIHGGLRYLQTGDLRRFRESVRERRWFLRCFPDLVRPLPCLLPIHGEGLRRPSVFRLAFIVNDYFSRILGGGAGERLPRSRVIGVEETAELFPGRDRRGLCGGALWYDGAMADSQRLLIEILRWACHAGASCLNYLEAVDLLLEGRRVAGVRAVDLHSGRELECRAPVVINAAGPWCRRVACKWDRDLPRLFEPSLAFNLFIDRPWPLPAAVAVSPRRSSGRTYFLHPWKGRLLAGTYHAPSRGPVTVPEVEEEQIGRFLADLDEAAPGLDLRRGEVARVHAGLLPAAAPGTERLAVREVIHDHGAHGGPPGLYSVSGVKFTTARLVAEKTLRLVARREGRGWHPAEAPGRPPAARIPGVEDLLTLLERDPALLRAHVRRIVEEESVLHLDDLLLRRTDWGIHPDSARAVAGAVASLLAPEGGPAR